MKKIRTHYSGILRLSFILMAVIFLFSANGFSQVVDTTGVTKVDSTDTQDESTIIKMESIAEQTDAEIDYQTILDNLNYYQEHPINLNNTNADELRKLMILTDIQIKNLLDHIDKNGKLLSVIELQTISGFDLEIINKLLPYVFVSKDVKTRRFSMNEILKNSKNQLMLRYQRVLEEQTGYTPFDPGKSINSRYLGSPDVLYAKYRFQYFNNISLGFTAKKEAGELFLKNNLRDTLKGMPFTSKLNNGFDYYSAHLFVKDFGVLKALAIGDFQAQYGQGLTLWTGLGFGKSSDITGVKKDARGISPYTSTTDNIFMRGIGTTIGIKDFEFSAFFSNKKIDGNVTTDSTLDQEETYFTSLGASGLHATPSEVEDKDAITEKAYGGHVCYKTRTVNIGATAFRSEYDPAMNRKKNNYYIDFKNDAIVQFDDPYNQFYFAGKSNTNIGIDYSYVYRNINVFGEVSQSENNARAFLSGLLIAPDSKVSLSMLYRNYDKKYQAIYTSAFAESSNSANEKGFYTGILLKPSRAITINAYMDNSSFAWLTFRSDAPSKRFDYSLQVNWNPTKKLEMYARYRQKNYELYSVSDTVKSGYRFHLSYVTTPNITLKCRVELSNWNEVTKAPEKGYVVYQDIVFKKTKSPLSLTFRYAMFDCPTYNSRIYMYENDVLYGYSIPALYNKGIRCYVVAKYRISRNIDVWLRLAQTSYSNKNVIGSGLTEIKGNTKSEVKAQVRFRF